MDIVLPYERRRYRRYIVPGQAKFRIDSIEALGDLVNIGQGGVLLRSSVVLPEGMDTTILLTVGAYPRTFEVSGQVAGAKNGLLAIRFRKEPDHLQELLLWLARENVPWTATCPSRGSDPAQSQRTPSTVSAEEMNENELEALRAYLHQLG